MNLTVLDSVVLASYMLAIAFMGLYFSRRNTDTEQYFVGGRSFAGWAVGLSLVGTSISSITFLAYPADAFKTAWLRFLPALGLPVAILVSAIFFLPVYRKLRLTSAYEYLEYRFGPSVRVFITRLLSGNLLLVKHGPIEKKTKRSYLTAFLSTDDGKSWGVGCSSTSDAESFIRTVTKRQTERSALFTISAERRIATS